MMINHSHQIVQKHWNYCNVLRDDLSAYDAQAGGMSYGDYPSAKLRDGVWRERISAGGLSWEVHEDHP